MQPRELTAASFKSLPPEGQALATTHVSSLQALPLVFAPILLRQIATYDWLFPAERGALQRQLTFLSAPSQPQRDSVLRGFAGIDVAPELARQNWVSDPAGFMEKLTASLWSTHQIERFRALAETYQQALDRALPPPKPRTSRLGVVVLGAGVPTGTAIFCRKLQRYGVTFTSVKAGDNWRALVEHALQRASVAVQDNAGFRHWYIDGGSPDRTSSLVQVSYRELEPARSRLLAHVQKTMASDNMGPEQLRSSLAQLRPRDVGLAEDGSAGVLNRFQLSLLTEGSGTQIFSTTFVQWAARECIRRAEPETVLLRFRPRQQAQNLNRMLMPGVLAPDDPEGSLVDAEMGAYYTWLEMRRLSGSEELRFLVWFENGARALLIGPGLPRNTSSETPVTMAQLLKLLA